MELISEHSIFDVNMAEQEAPVLTEAQIAEQRALERYAKNINLGANKKPVVEEEGIVPGEKKKAEEQVVDPNAFDFEVNENGEKPAAQKPKDGEQPLVTNLNLARFRPYIETDKPEITEEDIETGLKTYRESSRKYQQEAEANKKKLATVLEGRKKLVEDKDFVQLNELLSLSPKERVERAIAWDYMNSGLDKNQALSKAKERIEESEKTNKYFLDDKDREIRTWATGQIGAIQNKITQELEEASKDVAFLTPSAEFEKAVLDYAPKMTDVLGMPLTKDEKERAKLVKGAYIAPDKLSDMLKDPATYNEVCFILSYKNKIKGNIARRASGKAALHDTLPKYPSSGGNNLGARQPVRKAETDTNPLTKGVGFFGEKAI